ncbi:MAG TPA: hypothetical protein VMW33_15025, partial [Ilumatobacteraceae bacterium]|nr:hypothetical protein [Ilumatobacteraceae bacterium]
MRKISFGIVLSLVLVAGACGSDDGGSDDGGADGEGALAAYYDQDLEWGECGDGGEALGGECATVQVPIDYDDPSAGDTFIFLVRVPASGDAQGTLFVNPGGPGESGVDFAPTWALLLDPEVTAAYDVVGFD